MHVNHVDYYRFVFHDFIIDDYYKNEVTSIAKTISRNVDKTKEKVAPRDIDSHLNSSGNYGSYTDYTSYNNYNYNNDNWYLSNNDVGGDPFGLYSSSIKTSAKGLHIPTRHKVDINDHVVFDTDEDDKRASDLEEPPAKRIEEEKQTQAVRIIDGQIKH